MKRISTLFLAVVLAVLASLMSCSDSEIEAEDILEEIYGNDLDAFLEDTYYEGFYDALDCVDRTGGSAENAASYCKR